MKRYLWILALPYVVVSSRTIQTNGIWEMSTTYTHVAKSDNKFGFIECGNDKDICEDLAAALNEAHERRTSKTEINIDTTAYHWARNTWKDSKKADWQPADYKKACEGSCSEDK